MPVAADANINAKAHAGPAEARSRPEDPLEKILNRYGSELGNVNRTAR
jgi:hypothetical protein